MTNSVANPRPASVERTLKTGYLIRQRGYIGRRKQTTVPKIDLCGKWLEAAGFAIGQPISVQVLAGQLIITSSPKREGDTVTRH